MTVFLLILSAIIGYLLGSINTSVILSKVVYKTDIREKGSGNAGTTNALRSFGKKAAVFTLLGDFIKGILAVLIGWLLVKGEYHELAGVLAGGCAILGHNWPVYFGFKGGKGVLTTLAVMLLLAPIPALIALLVFVVTVLITRYVSLGSMLAALVLPFLVFFRGNYISQPGGLSALFWFSVFVAVLIIARHHANIGRLVRGEESKLFGKKKEK